MSSLLKTIENQLKEWLIETRKWFHKHPELSFKEFETSKKIESLLKEWGFQIDRSFSKTSIIATLKNGNGKCLAIRSDMDALPLKEETNLEYKSINEGCMHACGHDGHMTIALGAAKYISEKRNFKGTVMFIFQAAEEIGSGAKEIISNGLFEKYNIDFIIGLHGMSNVTIGKELKEGTICFYSKNDAMMASTNIFEIIFKGRGGHGSSPEDTIDPIPSAIEFINSIYYLKNRNVPSKNRCVLSVCNISSGSASAGNIIPDYCVVKGTFRTVDEATRKLFESKIKEYAECSAKKFGLSLEFKSLGNDAVYNDFELNEKIKEITINELGNKFVNETEQVMGGEDFSFYGQKVPSVFVFISTGDKCPIHNSKYDFGDKSLTYGVTYFVNTINKLLV
ncbi:M20 metallopeptidase family protein [Malacoplasma iowae]|uniref:M20 family metallopeptidase n=1 Tax=Malacoplasma iowae 695 TaxID=1048830 RepID=A0A6P1LD77_MALIO|nr:M20 family metallopeptidase [Malacoplasma iowae]VEU63177.1 Uncharacterized hydrolase YxeP [Mycoplasmopsis fermentans]EGZ31267.1 putative amidohydrolase [Malacoplasma iowae 695]QHG89564.1 M20 family metallopeptidase [Malacoplasma iowae 695]WPL35657.1 M20 family metallopeptidase [Malacoplasma iowae]VEU71914.1 Uncharacterized hydrolase YxeP [Malacoplasma iowae]